MRFLFALISFTAFHTGFSQQNFSFKIVDHGTGEPIPGALISIPELKIGTAAAIDGTAILEKIPEGTYQVKVSSVGYLDTLFEMSFPTRQQEPKIIYLVSNEMLDEIIIEGTRSNKSISDTPTRTEALTDEIDEAASMEPGKVSHLLTHTTGVNVQTTSASSNGSVIRMQGMNGRYTQLLKDGFPMYGGFSGSFDIMTIPPLDLRQVEFIKGSASTLYGGGAIGGIVNLISKTPAVDETLLHLNYSSIGARDLNAFVSRKFGNFGFTNLASFHNHMPYDADGDGFSDITEVGKYNFNPRFFYTPNNYWSFYAGFNMTNDHRRGGDMNLLYDEPFSLLDFYLDEQRSQRYSTQAKISWKISDYSTIEIRNSVSYFKRYLTIQENQSALTRFKGEQLSSFSELNYGLTKNKHTLVVGVNYVTDNFDEFQYTTDTVRDQWYQTTGIFINEVWDLHKKISLEGGLRADYVMAASTRSDSPAKLFILPRLSSLFKIAKGFTVRLGGGMGYRMPTIFNEDSEPIGFKNIRALDFTSVKPEESMGGNLDFKYTTNLGSENLLLSVNQMFFYNIIDNPIFLLADSTGYLEYKNYGNRVHSRGFETQIKFTFWKITWFLGYTYNEAFHENDSSNIWLTLTPKHSIKGDFLFVDEGKWRIGVDYEYKSSQWLSNGISTPGIFMSGIVIERTFGNLTLFVNAENYTDVRQTRYESLISSPNNTPQHTEIWAPLDGRFINGGAKLKL